MEIAKNIKYIGVDDMDIDLFEGQYEVPEGISYNSYLIDDEKIAVMDTVDARKTEEWLSNLEAALAGRTPDYLIIHHMEPDHASNVRLLLEKYPACKGVCTQKAAVMVKRFFDVDFTDRLQLVKEGDTVTMRAGAGIVADSDPEKEYEETINKSKAVFEAVKFAETL